MRSSHFIWTLGLASVFALGAGTGCGGDDEPAGKAGSSGTGGSGGAGGSTGGTGGSSTGGTGGGTGGSSTGGTAGSSTGGGGGTALLDPIILEDFSDLRTNASLPNPEVPPQPLWYPQFESSNPQVSNSILSVTANGAPQIYFRPADDNGWFFIRALVESGAWSDNGFNRLRFHVKQPDGLTTSSTGQHNVEWASFLHVGSATDGPWGGSDDNNWHWYHFLDLPSDGLWYHVIIDTFPDHQRSEAGSTEQGDQEFPDGGGTYNYFSMMTSFYYDIPGASTTGSVQFKPYSLFYEDNATVPLAQVRSLNGAFDPAQNTIKLGWCRRKDQSGHEYTVRWSYSPITTFDSASLAGTVTSPDTDAYNGVHFTFSEPEFANHDLVYIAIQPNGSSLFRQFWLELT